MITGAASTATNRGSRTIMLRPSILIIKTIEKEFCAEKVVDEYMLNCFLAGSFAWWCRIRIEGERALL